MAGNAAHGINVSVIAPAAYLRDFAAQDPVVTSGTAAYEIGQLAQGFVRPA